MLNYSPINLVGVSCWVAVRGWLFQRNSRVTNLDNRFRGVYKTCPFKTLAWLLSTNHETSTDLNSRNATPSLNPHHVIFLDKGILNNIPASTWKRYIRLLLQTLRDKQEVTYKPQSLLLNCHPFHAKMSIAVTSKARHASAIKPLSSSFCKIAHVLVR